ncbi:pupal cuticle protein-like [Daphnia pulex]|uniref:pupal cuticle protein-like n=1 Tax=Daphnia pulex TaxID=6669 RepID=UPI001EDEC187|nr:pupal cuticle protein-like [Daphnia pulex]
MKTSVAALLLLACAVSGQTWGNTGAYSDIARQFQSQDGFGQAKFGYSHPGQSAETHRDARGNQVGSYAYINPEGREIRVNYIADENGYRVDNDYTQETPEVAAARSAHLAAHAAALAAARAASPNQEQWVAPQPKKSVPAPVPVQQIAWTAPPTTRWNTVQAQPGLPQSVQDTPEVAAAKAEFFNTFRIAAARVPKEENVVVPAKKTWTAPVTNWVAPAAQKSWVAPTPTWASAQPVQYGPPQPVQDTPEVQAARNAFFASFREAAARVPQQQNVVVPQQKSWAAPQEKSWVAPQQKSWSGSYQPVVVDQYGLPQQVQETPDVAAARAEFFRSFNAAAAAAAAAQRDTTSSF